MHNNTAVCTQQPTRCHIAADWKLWLHQYENLQHHNIKFPFKLLSNFSLQFKVTLPAHNPVYSDAGGKVSILGADRNGHKKKFHMTMCLTVSGYRDRAVWIYRLNYIRFWFMGLDKGQSLQTKGGYMRQTVCSNFRSAACIQKHADQLRRTTHNICTQPATCIEVDGGLSEHLLWTVINLLFMCNKFVI